MYSVILLAILSFATFTTLLAAMKRYKTCPSNKILVKYGNVGKGRSALTIHGGATFVWPLIQQYEYLDLEPINTDIPLEGALSKQNIRVNVPSQFTFGIGTTEELMSAAAERLLGLSKESIEKIARDIIFGQLRATVAAMDIEEVNSDREVFARNIMSNIESELKKIGLYLINVNIVDITDDAGYIDALGKKAAAEAINTAKVEVAKQHRDGSVGSALAEQDQRIKVAEANARAVEGENESFAAIAESDAERIIKEAEALRKSSAAQLVKAAQAKQEGYKSEREAEETRAEKERSTQKANIIVPAEIEKEKAIIDAEAKKRQEVLKGESEGEALQAKMYGEAQGLRELLSKQAEGIKAIVNAAGGSADKAAMLMIVQDLPEIAKLQATAISNIDFGKIVVYDGGGSKSEDGGSTTSNWISNVTKSLPGLHEFAKMSGIELPGVLGKITEDKPVDNNTKTEAAKTEVATDSAVSKNPSFNSSSFK
jgi:flotillin